jgi:hypothetical protein
VHNKKPEDIRLIASILRQVFERRCRRDGKGR